MLRERWNATIDTLDTIIKSFQVLLKDIKSFPPLQKKNTIHINSKHKHTTQTRYIHNIHNKHPYIPQLH